MNETTSHRRCLWNCPPVEGGENALVQRDQRLTRSLEGTGAAALHLAEGGVSVHCPSKAWPPDPVIHLPWAIRNRPLEKL